MITLTAGEIGLLVGGDVHCDKDLLVSKAPVFDSRKATPGCIFLALKGEVVDGHDFAADAYRDYLELHGLSVQLTEALAEHWHARIREEMAVRGEDSSDLQGILDQGYRGSRYSFGYPACPNLEDQIQCLRTNASNLQDMQTEI